MPSRVTLALLVAAVSGAVLSPAAALRSAAETAPETSGLRLSTPVLSARRLPGVVTRVIADRRLQTQLDQALNDPRLQGGREQACLTVRDSNGRDLFTRRPDMSLIPASTLKMITGGAVLARLGPDERLTTEVRAATPARDGAVERLWMVGGGDPLLATADHAAVAGYLRRPRLATPIEKLADSVVAAGIRSVGSIAGDDSRYDRQRFVPSWKPRYITDFEITPISALTVNGGFLTLTPPTPAQSAAAHAAGVLTSLLRARGVTVTSDPVEASAPAGASVIASIDSPPLAAVVADMLQHSDNLAAEMLVKELGVRFGGAGTTAAGLEVIRSTLPSIGVSPDGLVAVDGSGLDRSNRLPCRLLHEFGAKVGEASPLAQGLPVAGRNGTLVRRFLSTPAEGRVRAKTGSLEFVVGLSGWASPVQGGSLQFSLLVNDLPRTSVGLAVADSVVNILVRYPESPPPADLAPSSPVAGAAN